VRVTKKIKDQLLKAADYKCEYCGVEVNERIAVIDHKIPLKAGGTSEAENLAIACPKCNFLKADKILGSISNPVVESAAKLWIHAYIKFPVATAIISIAVSVGASFLAYQGEQQRKAQTVAELSKNSDFSAQIQQLSETEKNLKTLLAFVSAQKDRVTDNERNIQQLESEKQRLEPLVSADRATVDAFFKAQEERARKNASQERWIGFGLGILASMFASFIIVVGKFFYASWRKNS
jgi:DNA-directed RNA polymerase subunit RPC12/RpoP